MDYSKLYTHIFNAVTDAIEQIEKHNYGIAEEILKKAQEETEEMYVNEAE